MQAVPGLGPVDGDLEQVPVAADEDVLVAVLQHGWARRGSGPPPRPGGGHPFPVPAPPDRNRLADRLLRGRQQVEQLGIVAPGDEAAAAAIQAADHDAGPAAVAGVLDRVGGLA